MAYTDEAMISVIQKALDIIYARQGDGSDEFVSMELDGVDELDCFRLTKHQGYFTTDHEWWIMSIMPGGVYELSRLIEKKNDIQCKEAEHQIQQKLLTATKISTYSAWFSSLVLFGTLMATMLNNKPVILQYPVQVEILSSSPPPIQPCMPVKTNRHKHPANKSETDTDQCEY